MSGKLTTAHSTNGWLSITNRTVVEVDVTSEGRHPGEVMGKVAVEAPPGKANFLGKSFALPFCLAGNPLVHHNCYLLVPGSCHTNVDNEFSHLPGPGPSHIIPEHGKFKSSIKETMADGSASSSAKAKNIGLAEGKEAA